MSGCSPVLDHSEVLTTGNELPVRFDMSSGTVPVEESPIIKPQEEPISSPVRSFQALYSSQGSEKGMKEAQMIPYVSSTNNSNNPFQGYFDENCFQCYLIYKSLLIERQAGNLTDMVIGMVLAGKPPASLPVIHERLKHLIISSEAFQKKKRIECNAQM